jgi:YD repeat-containing protein
MRRLILILTMTAATLAAEKLTYTYDDAGRLARVESDSGKVITYTYDASGNLVKRTATGAPAPAPAAEANAKKKKSK